MKKIISGMIIGAVLATAVGGFAVNSIYDNPYPIFVNGTEKHIQGYNVDDYSYFKLRDIADAVGGFNVDFNNNQIQISTGDYVYNNPTFDYSKYLGSYSRMGGSLGFKWSLNIISIDESGVEFEFAYEKPNFYYKPNKAIFSDATHAVADGLTIFDSPDMHNEEYAVYSLVFEDNGVRCTVMDEQGITVGNVLFDLSDKI